MTIPVDALPPAALWSGRGGPVRRTSALDGSTVQSAEPDASVVPRLWTLSWPSVRREVAAAIRIHYRQHATATFTATNPRNGQVVTLIWASPPSIRWVSPTTASVTADFETALAHS